MRGATLLWLSVSILAAAQSHPASETSVHTVSLDGKELQPAASTPLGSSSGGAGGVNSMRGDGELQGSAGVHYPHLHHYPHLEHALPQIALLLQLLQHLLHGVLPPLHLHDGHHHHHLHGHHLNHLSHYSSGLLNTKGVGSFYGPGLYGVSATNAIGKGRPFGPYKYEDDQR